MGFSILNNVELVKTHFYEQGFISIQDVVRISSVNRAFHQKYFSDPNFCVWMIHNSLFTHQFKTLRTLLFAPYTLDVFENLKIIGKVQQAIGSVSRQLPLAGLSELEDKMSTDAEEYKHIGILYYCSRDECLLKSWKIQDELKRLMSYRESFIEVAHRVGDYSQLGPALVWLVKNLARVQPSAVVETVKMIYALSLPTTQCLDQIVHFLFSCMPDAAYEIFDLYKLDFRNDLGLLIDFPDTQKALEITRRKRDKNYRSQCYKVIAQGLAKRDPELCQLTLDRISIPRIKIEAILECIKEFLALNQIENALEFADLLPGYKEDAYKIIAEYTIETNSELPDFLLQHIQTPRIIFYLKMRLAKKIISQNLERALAIIESIPNIEYKVYAYLECIDFIPSDKWEYIHSVIALYPTEREYRGYNSAFINTIMRKDPRTALQLCKKGMNMELWSCFNEVIDRDLPVAEELLNMLKSSFHYPSGKLRIDLRRKNPNFEKLLKAWAKTPQVETIITFVAKTDVKRAIRLYRMIPTPDPSLKGKIIEVQAPKDPIGAIASIRLLAAESEVKGLESIVVNTGVFAHIPQVLEVYKKITTPHFKLQMLSVLCAMMPKASDCERIRKEIILED